jgi:hypothetical protein
MVSLITFIPPIPHENMSEEGFPAVVIKLATRTISFHPWSPAIFIEVFRVFKITTMTFVLVFIRIFPIVKAENSSFVALASFIAHVIVTVLPGNP